LLRFGVRGDVVILRFASEQKIAHAAADPEGLKSSRVEAANDFLWGFAWRGVGHLRFTIYDLRASLPADSSIVNRIS